MPKKLAKKLRPVVASLPTEKIVKVGYRDIQIKYVSPDFKTDDMTESYGEYRPREGVILLQKVLCGQEMVKLHFMRLCMHVYMFLDSIKPTVR